MPGKCPLAGRPNPTSGRAGINREAADVTARPIKSGLAGTENVGKGLPRCSPSLKKEPW
jgi:hypothetical protein